MNTDLNKNLDELEQVVWGPPNYDSHLVIRCHELRLQKLKDFTVEDLRLMTGQNIGLKYLMPIAIEKLKEEPLAEGNLFEGDLLLNVLKSAPAYWESNPHHTKDIIDIIKRAIEELKTIETTDEIITSITEAAQTFRHYTKRG